MIFRRGTGNFFPCTAYSGGWMGIEPRTAAMDGVRHHLAVLEARYLAGLVAGRKTVECRLSRTGCPPYGVISPGDLVWLKESGGPVRGLAGVARVEEFAELTPAKLRRLRTRFHDLVAAPASFWCERKRARFATLIRLEWVCAVQPFRVLKRDRRSWVVLGAPPVPGQPLKCAPVAPDLA